MLIVNTWVGGLGNSINVLTNALHIVLYYKEQIKFTLPHKFFNLKYIENMFKDFTNNRNFKFNNDIFYKAKLINKHKLPSEIFNQNKNEVYDILRKSFIIDQKDIIPLPEDILVIHIRSGDIFSKKPHKKYVPPPLWYYTNIINKHNFKQIIIVSENKLNPCVDKLLELYPNAVYNKNNIIDDINIILGASYIIYSVGTFVPSLLRLNPYIKRSFYTDEYKNELKDYYKYNLPWFNNKNQYNLILDYKYNKVE